MNVEGREFKGDYNGVPYDELEDGSVVLHDGSILSDTNPVNPKTLSDFEEVNPEKAAWGSETWWPHRDWPKDLGV